jgi:peroxiredoxin
MAVVGLGFVIAAYGAYLAMLFVLHRFTYRTWLFNAVIIAGIGFATVGLLVGDPVLPAWIAIGLGLAWFPLTRRELTLYGSERLAIKPGDRLPSFAALRPDGTALNDQEVVGHAPALLILYRGWWCPSTKALFDELYSDRERLTTAGLTIFAASVDPPAQAVGMQDYVGDGITIICSFPVAVLDAIGACDRRGAPWYDRLLIRAPAGEIAMPTALVVDTAGRIVYAFRARRVDERARPADILAALGDRGRQAGA